LLLQRLITCTELSNHSCTPGATMNLPFLAPVTIASATTRNYCMCRLLMHWRATFTSACPIGAFVHVVTHSASTQDSKVCLIWTAATGSSSHKTLAANSTEPRRCRMHTPTHVEGLSRRAFVGLRRPSRSCGKARAPQFRSSHFRGQPHFVGTRCLGGRQDKRAEVPCIRAGRRNGWRRT
jgi:hypothetical protein